MPREGGSSSSSRSRSRSAERRRGEKGKKDGGRSAREVEMKGMEEGRSRGGGRRGRSRDRGRRRGGRRGGNDFSSSSSSSSSRSRRRSNRDDYSSDSYSGSSYSDSYSSGSDSGDDGRRRSPKPEDVILGQNTRDKMASLKAGVEANKMRSSPKPLSKAGVAAAKFLAVAGFKAAGKRQEVQRTTGTALGREGTGIHSTLSRIRSDKGREVFLKYVQSEEKGVLVRPEDVWFLFSEDDLIKKIWTVVILTLVVFTSITIPL